MKLAVVEDDINMRKSLEIALGEYKEFEVVSFKSAKDALKKLDDSFDLVITDINMPQMDGIEFLRTLNGRYEALIITGNATLNKAIDSIRLGVKDFLTKPFEIETLVEAIYRAKKAKEVLTKAKPKSIKTAENKQFIATSPALEGALKLASKAAKTDASVLLLGESGVGKELFANFIHANSLRASAPFIALNMAAIPENLLESELFGYEKGAFTDATEGRAGKFEAANGGSIFLDEIGEMPMGLQAKLLRVLQEKEVVRLGSSKPIKIDIRFIAATNADIKKKIKKGEFREDLYFRLQTIPINIPPLRERVEEIIPLCEWKLAQVDTQYGIGIKKWGNGAKEQLLSYRWPGNIRELLSVIERAAILCEEDTIMPEDLFLSSRESGGKKKIANLEEELICEALKSCDSDVDGAAELLGLKKDILLSKMERYNIKF
ncbi:sigma-54-dependent transcriptional regulator [Helicobacter winghamensis]|uniref:AAA family ATPase n=1 Tax=Helicobacter winghamensis TaxID=157268 RepID=A0A2N3PKH6_9HELI|nr:sigma-54 dependent transcriptional regulator [Helicobacter winghamensis]EEO25980.1 Sigma-54 interaction domain protein [Helicobacter winghamensis ATCC BAA-430]PKT76991.1 AAA family ATPase [Helicobacter winghamensis]PKT77131.1 AAA family ATPase [Helicobacter winghamensis]PKT77691.1 AAA family ATPase [Helicobacter winghamensis]PKT81929.1 AAA family ATPase [Helicobacter winghamensis]